MPKLKAILGSLIALFALVLSATGAPTAVASTSNPATNGTAKGFVSYPAFLSSVVNASYQAYSTRGVRSAQAFAQMRSYILDMYAGVKQVNSFVLHGQYFDCITVDSQPSVTHSHITHIAAPPRIQVQKPEGKAARSPLTMGKRDAFGNAISCAAGTIPMKRITLDIMSRFHTLHDYLAKEPESQAAAPHRYAHANQYVNNYGGHSWLNLWNPSGDFTLSQQWYPAFMNNTVQTVEGVWVHYPAKFGDQSVLFIFYTPDGYKTGCYNLDCTAFVQTSNIWALGGAFTNYSTYGGDQWGFDMGWLYYKGNWWLYLRGAGDYTAVGYYPGSIYNGGPLASSAQAIDYGGETYTGGLNGLRWAAVNSPKLGGSKLPSKMSSTTSYPEMMTRPPGPRYHLKRRTRAATPLITLTHHKEALGAATSSSAGQAVPAEQR